MTESAGRRCRLALVGPTASGKSAIGHALALAAGDVEIVSVDSMQVYRGMDIGTAKPTTAERAEVHYHLLDLVDPHEEYSVGRFVRAARDAIADIEHRGRRVLLVGGTGLHLRAIIDDLQPPPPFPQHRADLDANPDTASLYARLAALDPAAAAKMEPTNRRRIIRALEVCLGTGRPFSSFGPGLTAHPAVPYLLVALQWPRLLLDARIAARYEAQMAAGFLDEVRRLAGAPQPLSGTARQALGYRELLGHLAGEATLDEALDLARVRTRQFARRQERWFRRDPRIRWWPLAGGSSEVDPQLNPVEVAQALLEEWMHPTTES